MTAIAHNRARITSAGLAAKSRLIVRADGRGARGAVGTARTPLLNYYGARKFSVLAKMNGLARKGEAECP